MTGARVAGVALLLGALWIRAHNALVYPPDRGFDASFIWTYVWYLTGSWGLPPPDVGWATADPPLFYYLSAAVWRALAALGAAHAVVLALPLLSTVAGLAVVALAVALVRRSDPGNERRAWLAGGLLLYLPAHIQMSVMVNEEMLAALLASAAIFALASREPDPTAGGVGLWRAAGVGFAGGLALLTKLTGVLAVATAVATYAVDGWARRSWRPALRRAALVALVAALCGGWFYARNRLEYGWLHPFALPTHRIILRMPPGERSLADYVCVPLATWTDPQLLHPDLLHSVWGSTYVTVWFDGHRHFLPPDSAVATRLGTATLVLALLPTAAFAFGLVAGLRRVVRSPASAELPLLLITALTLAGFAAHTWRNPWYEAVKGTYLLGLSLPFAFYASEPLARWTRPGRRLAAPVWIGLAGLVVLVVLTTGYDLVVEAPESPGLDWESAPGAR